MIIKPNDKITAEVVAESDKRLDVTPDSQLATFEACELRLAELRRIKADYLLIESKFSASRLTNLARSYRGKVAALKRRIKAVMERMQGFPQGLAMAEARAAEEAGRQRAALLADKGQRGEMIPDEAE